MNMKSIKDYLINKISAIKEFEVLSNIEDERIYILGSAVDRLADDQFILTATETGIKRREKMLNIQPFADDTLESRRFRIMSRWNDQLPYTYKGLMKKLDTLVGENGFRISLNDDTHTLSILISLTQKRMLQDVKLVISNMIPANIVMIVDLQYLRVVDVGKMTIAQLINMEIKDFKVYTIINEVQRMLVGNFKELQIKDFKFLED